MNFEIKTKPRSERAATVKKALGSAERTYRLDDFRGEPRDLKVIQLEVGLPIYRMANCRTYSEQQEHIAKNGLDSDFFQKAQESSSAQLEQHKIIRKITKNAKASVANIDDILTKEAQTDPLLITSTGVVVNGNRRLSAMRDLYASHPIQYSSFAYVSCAVLPNEASSKDINTIERALQGRPQTKLDYDWIGDAELLRVGLSDGLSIEQVADQLRRKVPELKNEKQALIEAELYLSDWVDKSGQYSLVRDDGLQIFKDLAKQISGQDTQMQNASRAIAWSLFDNRDKLSGRVYGYNPAFGKLATEVIGTVVEELGLDLSKTNDSDDPDDSGYDFLIEENEQTTDYSAFIDTLKSEETRDSAFEVLLDVAHRVIDRAKGKKKKDAALNSLTTIHAKMAAIDISTSGQGTYSSMLNQISSINSLSKKLQNEIESAINSSKGVTGKSTTDE